MIPTRGLLLFGGGQHTPDHSPWASTEDLLAERIIRYVDAAECATLDVLDNPRQPIAPTTEQTHDVSEIHPLLMLGVTAACIPLSGVHLSPCGYRRRCSATSHHAMRITQA